MTKMSLSFRFFQFLKSFETPHNTKYINTDPTICFIKLFCKVQKDRTPQMLSVKVLSLIVWYCYSYHDYYIRNNHHSKLQAIISEVKHYTQEHKNKNRQQTKPHHFLLHLHNVSGQNKTIHKSMLLTEMIWGKKSFKIMRIMNKKAQSWNTKMEKMFSNHAIKNCRLNGTREYGILWAKLSNNIMLKI